MGLGEHALVVAERLDRVARVDEVEVVGRVHPLCLGVVDHEFDVGGRPGRLDGAEVDALDEGAWVLLAHLGNVRPFFPVSFRLWLSLGLGVDVLSTHHVPVPVPRSRMFSGFLRMGA